MTTAYVTRCPYCGAVWRLPDRDCALRGPVRCSECRHSFDAASNWLEVPEKLFPEMPPAMNPSDVPGGVFVQNKPVHHAQAVAEQKQSAEPAPQPKSVAPDSSDRVPDPLARLQGKTPVAERQTAASEASLAGIVPARSKPAGREKPVERKSIEVVTSARRRTVWPSMLLGCALMLALFSALTLIFNQHVLSLMPQSRPLFQKICGALPCPGFFLSEISAFAIKKNELRAVDEAGNYVLEISFANLSDMPQAVPSLNIEFFDDSGASLLRRTLLPSDYLDAPLPASIAPGRNVTVRWSMHSNAAPSRCVVQPVYPK